MWLGGLASRLAYKNFLSCLSVQVWTSLTTSLQHQFRSCQHLSKLDLTPLPFVLLLLVTFYLVKYLSFLSLFSLVYQVSLKGSIYVTYPPWTQHHLLIQCFSPITTPVLPFMGIIWFLHYGYHYFPSPLSLQLVPHQYIPLISLEYKVFLTLNYSTVYNKLNILAQCTVRY